MAKQRDERESFFLFFLCSSLFDTRSFNRRNSTRATCEYQKHGISPRIQVRSLENPKFRYFFRSTAF